jgi:hypothetical protein
VPTTEGPEREIQGNFIPLSLSFFTVQSST